MSQCNNRKIKILFRPFPGFYKSRLFLLFKWHVWGNAINSECLKQNKPKSYSHLISLINMKYIMIRELSVIKKGKMISIWSPETMLKGFDGCVMTIWPTSLETFPLGYVKVKGFFLLRIDLSIWKFQFLKMFLKLGTESTIKVSMFILKLGLWLFCVLGVTFLGCSEAGRTGKSGCEKGKDQSVQIKDSGNKSTQVWSFNVLPFCILNNQFILLKHFRCQLMLKSASVNTK